MDVFSALSLVATNTHEQCYDTQFVTSEVNANVKLYLLQGSSLREAVRGGKQGESIEFLETKGTTLHFNDKIYTQDPFEDPVNNVGYLTATKKVGGISANCRAHSASCQKELNDITYRKNSKKQHHDNAGYKLKQNDKRGPGESHDELHVATKSCRYGSLGGAEGFRFRKTGESLLRSQHIKRRREEGTESRSTRARPSHDEGIDASGEGDMMEVVGEEEEGYNTTPEEEGDPMVGIDTRVKQIHLGSKVYVEFDGTNRQPVATMSEEGHRLQVTVVNNGEAAASVNVGFSGLALDYRGVPLTRQTLRSGTKIPWRFVMKGAQTHVTKKVDVEAGGQTVVALVVPHSSFLHLHRKGNHFVRWTVATRLRGGGGGGGDADESVPPPIHEFNVKLV